MRYSDSKMGYIFCHAPGTLWQITLICEKRLDYHYVDRCITLVCVILLLTSTALTSIILAPIVLASVVLGGGYSDRTMPFVDDNYLPNSS